MTGRFARNDAGRDAKDGGSAGHICYDDRVRAYDNVVANRDAPTTLQPAPK